MEFWLRNSQCRHLTTRPAPPHLPCPWDLRAAGRGAARHRGGHPYSPRAFNPLDGPTRKSLSEGNQPGSAERQSGLGFGRTSGFSASALNLLPPSTLRRRNPLLSAARRRRSLGLGGGAEGGARGLPASARPCWARRGWARRSGGFPTHPQGGCEYFADSREPQPTLLQANGPTPPPSC